MLDSVFFSVFAAFVILGALGTIALRNPVHCAVALTASLVGVAGTFLLLGAEFLSVAQVIVYVGGIMVLFLFVIMLVNVTNAGREPRFSKNAVPAVALALLLGAAVLYFLTSRPLILAKALATSNSQGNVEQIGTALFTTHLLPFEIASVLLLAALVGSVVLAQKRI